MKSSLSLVRHIVMPGDLLAFDTAKQTFACTCYCCLIVTNGLSLPESSRYALIILFSNVMLFDTESFFAAHGFPIVFDTYFPRSYLVLSAHYEIYTQKSFILPDILFKHKWKLVLTYANNVYK